MSTGGLRLAGLLCAIASLTASPRAQSPDLPDAVNSVRSSVVKVVLKIKWEDEGRVPPDWCFHGSMICVAGTGFFVNDHGDVVTASHVADGVKQLQERLHAASIESQLNIGVSMPNAETSQITFASNTVDFVAAVIATDAEHDLALIRPDRNPFTNMPRLTNDAGAKWFKGLPQTKVDFVKLTVARAVDSEPVFACGYPFGEPGLVTTSGTIASAWNTTLLQTAQAAGFQSSQDVYNVDLRINPGNSGGPIFRLSDRSVIGVAVETIASRDNPSSGLGIAVPAKFVAAFLTAQHVTWTQANDPQNVPKEHKR